MVNVQQSAARTLTYQIIRQWYNYLERHCAITTVRVYKQIIGHCQPYLPKFIQDWKLEHIEHYLNSLGHLSKVTQNNRITALKSFGSWLEDHDLPNPARKLKYLKTIQKMQRTLTQGEYEAVLKVCRPDEKAIIQILAQTGIRASSLLNIRPEHIQNGFLFVTCKGHSRAVPLNKTCREILSKKFTINLLKNLTYSQLNNLCHRLSCRAGIEHFTAHSLRRYCATELLSRGVDIYRVSKLLGHSSVTITEKLYVKFSMNLLQGVTEVLD